MDAAVAKYIKRVLNLVPTQLQLTFNKSASLPYNNNNGQMKKNNSSVNLQFPILYRKFTIAHFIDRYCRSGGGRAARRPRRPRRPRRCASARLFTSTL